MKSFRAIKHYFLGHLIWCGKKLAAEKFFTSILVALKMFTKKKVFSVFYYSTLTTRPVVFLRLVRVGSTMYPTPAPITEHKRKLQAIKFLFSAVRDARKYMSASDVATLLWTIYRGGKNKAADTKNRIYVEALDNRSFVRNLRRILL